MFSRKGNHSESSLYKSSMTAYIAVLHQITCIFTVLLVLHCALQCLAAIADAYQSVKKYEYTAKINYYLQDNHFLHYVLVLVCVGAEFFFYLIHYHRIQQKKSSIGVVSIFAVIMSVHFVVFLFSYFVSGSELPPFGAEDESMLLSRNFAKKTTLPTVAYFITILLSVRKFEVTTKENH